MVRNASNQRGENSVTVALSTRNPWMLVASKVVFLDAYNSLAATLHVWRVKMNFISRKSLNDGTFPCFKRFLVHYKTRDIKIKNFLSQNRQNNRLSHMTHLFVWRVKMNFVSNESLNNGTLSRFKRSLTPCRTRDMKI